MTNKARQDLLIWTSIWGGLAGRAASVLADTSWTYGVSLLVSSSLAKVTVTDELAHCPHWQGLHWTGKLAFTGKAFTALANWPSLSQLLTLARARSIPRMASPVFSLTAAGCTAPHCITTHCTASHGTAQFCITPHCTAPHCIAPHCTALHCTSPHCTTLHYKHNTVTCYTAPHWNPILCTKLHCTNITAHTA